jgi:hypothetical protein
MSQKPVSGRPEVAPPTEGEVVSSGASELLNLLNKLKEGINKKIDDTRKKIPITIQKEDVEYEVDEQNNQIIVKLLDLVITINVEELVEYKYWTLEMETKTAKAFVASSFISYEDDELSIQFKPKRIEEDPLCLVDEEVLIADISEIIVNYWNDGDYALAEYINSFFFG